jgi:hypothetical protein
MSLTWVLLAPALVVLVTFLGVLIAFERASRKPLTPLDRQLARDDATLRGIEERERFVSPMAARWGLGVPVEHTMLVREDES